MTYTDVMTALKAGGAEVGFRTNGRWGYCATIGRPGTDAPEWLCENAALPDLAAVEAFFREQGATYFPDVVLP